MIWEFDEHTETTTTVEGDSRILRRESVIFSD